MSKQTTLASSQITPSGDTITVELVAPDDFPAVVSITWPASPTILDPKLFGDTAAGIVRMFSAAHIELARIKAWMR